MPPLSALPRMSHPGGVILRGLVVLAVADAAEVCRHPGGVVLRGLVVLAVADAVEVEVLQQACGEVEMVAETDVVGDAFPALAIPAVLRIPE